MRVDFNVPLTKQGEVADDARIRAAIPSIRFALGHDVKLVLCTHLGRPDGKPNPKYSVEPAAQRLGQILQEQGGEMEVILADDCIGEGLVKQSQELEANQVLMLENLRF